MQNKEIGIYRYPSQVLNTIAASPDCGYYLELPKYIKIGEFMPLLQDIFTVINLQIFEKNMHIVEFDSQGENDLDTARMAEKIMNICEDNGIIFLVKDRSDIALSLDCGLYISNKNKLTFTEIITYKELLGENKIMGLNCYASKALAKIALKTKMDFVKFTNFYSAKSDKLELLQWFSTYTDLPSVIEGNINEYNSYSAIKAGCNFISVGDYIFKDKKTAIEKISNLNKIIEECYNSKTIN